MAKNKHGLYVSKVKKAKQPKVVNGMNEVPGAYKKVNKKDENNMNVLMNRKDIKWAGTLRSAE